MLFGELVYMVCVSTHGCMDADVHMCIMFTCMWTPMCVGGVHVYLEARAYLVLGIFNCSSFYFLRQVVSLSPELTDSPGFPHICFSDAGIIGSSYSYRLSHVPWELKLRSSYLHSKFSTR